MGITQAPCTVDLFPRRRVCLTQFPTEEPWKGCPWAFQCLRQAISTGLECFYPQPLQKAAPCPECPPLFPPRPGCSDFTVCLLSSASCEVSRHPQAQAGSLLALLQLLTWGPSSWHEPCSRRHQGPRAALFPCNCICFLPPPHHSPSADSWVPAGCPSLSQTSGHR